MWGSKQYRGAPLSSAGLRPRLIIEWFMDRSIYRTQCMGSADELLAGVQL